MTSEPHFAIPEGLEAREDWGPGSAPASELPYQPWSHAEKVGRIADWTAQAPGGFGGQGGAPGGGHHHYYRAYGSSATGEAASAFFFRHEEEDDSFTLVGGRTAGGGPGDRDGSRGYSSAAALQRRRAAVSLQRSQMRGGQGGGFGGGSGAAQPSRGGGGSGKYSTHRWETPGSRDTVWTPRQVRESALEIKPSWTIREQVDFVALTKLAIDSVPDAADVVVCGRLLPINRPKLDRLSSSTQLPLEHSTRTVYRVTTTDDPIIRELSMSPELTRPTVFATDAILAVLMVCPRSAYPWDIVVNRVGPHVFLDKRTDGPLDFLPVNETASESIVDDGNPANTPSALAQEATFINQMYFQQILAASANPLVFERKNPFEEESPAASATAAAPVAYRYRRWKVTETFDVVARCEINALREQHTNPEAARDAFVLVCALNEWNQRLTDWRKRIDTSRGTLLATEIRNNTNKISRWAVKAMLSGCAEINLGYVSRAQTGTGHTILASQTFKTKDFIVQLSLNPRNMWAILKRFATSLLALPEGRYLIARDLSKPLCRIYNVGDDMLEH